jgi:hypothetical protein
LNITGGSRISPKVPPIYIIGFIDLNYFYSRNGKSIAPVKMSKEFTSGNERKTGEMWPGFGIGIQIK